MRRSLPSRATIAISNTGDTPLTLTSPILSSGFTMTTPFPITIAAGQSSNLQVRASAAVIGTDRGGTSRTGTLRFDLSDGGKRPTRWAVDIRRGDLSISHRNARADCVLKADQALFDGIVRGEVNPVAALLRGAMSAEGDLRLLIGFQRLFPDAPRSS